MHIVDNRNYLFQWFTPDGFRSLLALIGMNTQGIGTNAFSRWVKNILNTKLSEKEKQDVEQLIDVLYDDMDKGNFFLGIFYALRFNKFLLFLKNYLQWSVYF